MDDDHGTFWHKVLRKALVRSIGDKGAHGPSFTDWNGTEVIQLQMELRLLIRLTEDERTNYGGGWFSAARWMVLCVVPAP